MSNRLILTASIACLAGLALGAAYLVSTGRSLSGLPTATTGRALIGGPFELVDQNNKTVTDADFRGKHMLVYFGFTHCPDFCPAGLQVISEALEQLGPMAARYQTLFVTIDPERDTPEVLKIYLDSFHPSIHGLSGSAEQVAGAIREYRVYARKAYTDEEKVDYTMDHSLFLYLMGPDGAYVRHFNHGITPEKLAAALKEKFTG